MISPTAEQFRDTIAFLSSLQPLLLKHGIVKIRPPPVRSFLCLNCFAVLSTSTLVRRTSGVPCAFILLLRGTIISCSGLLRVCIPLSVRVHYVSADAG